MHRKFPLSVVIAILFLPVWFVMGQGVQGPAWEMGWVTDVDPKYIVEVEEDWDLEGELVFYVNNEGLSELTLELTYDFDGEGPFTFDGPESVSIPGNSNDTFSITIAGKTAEEVRSFSPSSKIELTVIGEETVGGSTIRSQEIQADVAVPKMFRLIPEIIPPTETLFAGSWVDFTLEVSNLGNTQDAIKSSDVNIRSCPHLSVTGMEEAEDTIVKVTTSNGENKVSFSLRLQATSSHQERSCELTISVQSEGDTMQRSDTISVSVKAPQANDDSPVSDEEEDSSLLSDSDLSWLNASESLAIALFAALFICFFRNDTF